MQHTPRILVVDDEPSIRLLLSRILQKEGFSTVQAGDADEAFRLLEDGVPDLALLDYDLPGESGKDICRRLRKGETTRMMSVIMVTGCTFQDLPVECLNSGADDYVSKPFEANELVARVRAVLRRPRIYEESGSVLQKGPIEVSPQERRVFINGSATQRLAPKEFELLRQLVLHSPRVLDRNTLALKVWGQTVELLHKRTLDVHIRRIRSKLGSASKHLVTVPAAGFQWRETSAS